MKESARLCAVNLSCPGNSDILKGLVVMVRSCCLLPRYTFCVCSIQYIFHTMYSIQYIVYTVCSIQYIVYTVCSIQYIIYTIDPLSEGLVTPPLGVEKLSPRFNFFDNMFSCIP